MTNQTLMLVSIVLCSLGGWYVVLTKYLELKAMSKNRSDDHDAKQIKIEPVSPDFHKLPADVNLTGKHIPGMGPPPHPGLPFSIPEDLLAAMNKLRTTAKPTTNPTAKPTSAAINKTANNAISADKRQICNWAAILHLSGFAIITGIPFLNIIIPSILWLLKKEQHSFLSKHGRDVINFQITFSIIQFLCLGMGALFVWWAPHAAQSLFAWTKTIRVVFGTSMHLPYNIFTIVPFFWCCVVMVRGAVAAYNGTVYKYPYSQPFLFSATAATSSKIEQEPALPPIATPPAPPVFNNMGFS